MYSFLSMKGMEGDGFKGLEVFNFGCRKSKSRRVQLSE